MRQWRSKRRLDALAALAIVGAVAASASIVARAEQPIARKSQFSAHGLQRVAAYMQNEVAAGNIPGAIVLIQQHGRPAYYETFGARDVAAKAPMTDEVIFRLYSMSKPVTSVAAMMLIDGGMLALGDPLSKFLPAFADVRAGVESRDESGKPVLKREPLARPITIEDLLRHTSGITYGFYGDNAVRKLYSGSNLFDGDFDNAQFAERLAKLPLAEQPETMWDYGHSTDVLGRVVEVVSGKSLYEFEKQRMLDPLGMRDTGFFVPESKRARVAAFLSNDRFERPIAGLGDPIFRRRWESGGAGMVGTIGDYARFCQMLLNGGALDGRRYLKPETVALMASDHVGPGTGIGRDPFYFPGADGFGLGFAVRTEADESLPAGEYRWDGVGGTFFFIDPADDMFTIVMMQTPSQRGRIQTELKKLIYEALVR